MDIDHKTRTSPTLGHQSIIAGGWGIVRVIHLSVSSSSFHHHFPSIFVQVILTSICVIIIIILLSSALFCILRVVSKYLNAYLSMQKSECASGFTRPMSAAAPHHWHCCRCHTLPPSQNWTSEFLCAQVLGTVWVCCNHCVDI